MKVVKTKYLLVAAALVALVVVNPAAARQQPPEAPATGAFELDVHAHSSEFGSPSGAPTLFQTHPLPSPVPDGTTAFSYSAIPCAVPAPFNDTALRFDPNPYADEGVPSPAPVRHRVQGRIIDGDSGTVEGRITTWLCVAGEESKHRIVTVFEGTYAESGDVVTFTGDYQVHHGTGIFKDLESEGPITGRFQCLPPVLGRHGAANCQALGAYSDFEAHLRGPFEDPTT